MNAGMNTALIGRKGAGAGQAIEDGYILGRALQDYFKSMSPSGGGQLRAWTQVYQDVRLPRAQRVAMTSRDAVEIYQAQADMMKDLPFDQCVPEIRKRLMSRMKWVWTDDIDAEYNRVAREIRSSALTG
jgi:salicylate hydroxylase